MAQRQPLSNAFSTSAMESLLQRVGAADEAALKGVQSRLEQMALAMEMTSKKAARKISANMHAIDKEEFFKSLEQSSEKAGDAIAENIESGVSRASTAAKKHGKEIKGALTESVPKATILDQFTKTFSTKFPNPFKDLGPDKLGGVAAASQLLGVENAAKGAAAGVGAVTAAVEELGISLAALEALAFGPIGAVLFAIGASLAALITTISSLNDESAELSRNTGGNTEILKGFTSQIDKTMLATHLTHGHVVELGKAFANAGFPITEAAADLGDYLTLAGTGVKLFGLSDDAAAEYARSLLATGESAADATKDWNVMYDIMQKTNQTTKQVVDAFSQGNDVWREFGAITGESMSQFDQQILKTGGLFRALNIDVKDVGRSVADMLKDPKRLIMQANAVGAILGIDPHRILTEAYTDQSMAKEHQIEAALKFAATYQPAFGNELGASKDDLIAKYGQAGAGDRMLGRHLAAPYAASRLNLSEEEFNKSVEGFSAWRHGNGAHATGSMSQLIEQFIAFSQQAQSLTPGVKTGNMEAGVTSITATAGGTISDLNNKFKAFVDGSATPMVNSLAEISKWIQRIGSSPLFGGTSSAPSPLITKPPAMLPPAGLHNPSVHDIGRGLSKGWNALTKGQPAEGAVLPPTGAAFLMDRIARVTDNSQYPLARDPAFVSKVNKIAKRLGMDPENLMAVMAFESHLDPSARNTQSGASGLIQFMPDYSGTNGKVHHGSASNLGTSTDALRSMSAIQQLDYVEKYLTPFKGKMNSLQDAYMAVFAPVGVGKSADFPLYRQGTKAYMQNKGLDWDHNGVITAGEAARGPANRLEALMEEQNKILMAHNETLKTIAGGVQGVKSNQEDHHKTAKRQLMASGNSNAALTHHAIATGII